MTILFRTKLILHVLHYDVLTSAVMHINWLDFMSVSDIVLITVAVSGFVYLTTWDLKFLSVFQKKLANHPGTRCINSKILLKQISTIKFKSISLGCIKNVEASLSKFVPWRTINFLVFALILRKCKLHHSLDVSFHSPAV